MSRTERLLSLMELLRGRRVPVAGAELARELGISLRTLYRDIATLQGQGADIEGEAGLGYVLRPGFTLPPLMFSADEIEALVLGSRWVARRVADDRLGKAAQTALDRIAAVLPDGLRDTVDNATLLVANGEVIPEVVDFAMIRDAIRAEHKLRMTYRTPDGAVTERVVWPFAVGFFDKVRMVVGWCELRADFRSFRIDRISQAEPLGARYPRRRAKMLAEWNAREGRPPA
ncbi:helix-turn-helix transcriptional regulator [Devosia sp.]|uniref:helix-turn-helix transcriptional regulator n=1 Tax=Devosia sp. TaxID=1871048 RepID=UPI003A90CC16